MRVSSYMAARVASLPRAARQRRQSRTSYYSHRIAKSHNYMDIAIIAGAVVGGLVLVVGIVTIKCLAEWLG